MENVRSVKFVVKAVFHYQICSDELAFFFLRTIKGRTLCFSTNKSSVRVVFKCKFYFKKSIILIKKNINLRPPEWRFFSSPALPETRVLFFLVLAPFFREACAFSVAFKIKPLRVGIFQCAHKILNHIVSREERERRKDFVERRKHSFPAHLIKHLKHLFQKMFKHLNWITKNIAILT